MLEVGCGAGALTRHLLAAGHRVIATDASAAMLELARTALGGEADLRQLVLPEDPLPAALLRGAGTLLEEMPEAAELFWLSRATVSPAPMLAASAATIT